MKTLYLPSIVAALFLAGPVYAQAPAAAAAGRNGSMNGSQGKELVGMPVQTATGEILGKVKLVLLDDKGNAAYVVISHNAVMVPGTVQSAVPWANVKAMKQGDKLVADRLQLEQAPVFVGGTIPDPLNNIWKQEVDSYWSAKPAVRSP